MKKSKKENKIEKIQKIIYNYFGGDGNIDKINITNKYLYIYIYSNNNYYHYKININKYTIKLDYTSNNLIYQSNKYYKLDYYNIYDNLYIKILNYLNNK